MVRVAFGQQMLHRPMPERRLDALPDSAAPQLHSLLQFWSDAVARAGIPNRALLDAFTLRPWLGHISIYEAIDGGRDYCIRLEGTMIVAITGEDWTGRRASDVDRRYGSQLAEFMQEVTETGQPAIHTMRLFQNQVESITRLLLPICGRMGGPIDQVFLVMYADPKQVVA